MNSKITIVADEPIGTISPLVQGQFAEHLGKCCNEGLWVGPNSAIPNTHGFRNDVLSALKSLGVSMLRWPGGCYADVYHWRDGIGSPESRPVTRGESCGLVVEEDGGLGTHEFIWLCRQIGAEPYLAGNVGSGSPQEMSEWVQYCNESRNTTLAKERAANGHPDPMNVRYWGVGNENWGCGGHYDAESYAKEFRRYATFLHRSANNLDLVACGFHDDWNAKLLDVLHRDHLWMIDHLSIHRYYHCGHATEFTDDEHYELMRAGEIVERDLRASTDLIDFYTKDKKHKIGIALDEWGVWHPQATRETNYEAPSTMRDALSAAGVLDTFNKWCDSLTIANMAQIVNVLQVLVQTSGDRMWRTPTYWLFWLYRAHQAATAVRTEVEALTVEAGPLGVPNPGPLPLVSASASIKDGVLALSLSNRSMVSEVAVDIDVRGAKLGLPKSCDTLAGDPRAANSATDPDKLSVRPGVAMLDGSSLRIVAPPSSVQTALVPVVT